MLKERAREISILVAALDLLLLVVAFFTACYLRAYVLPGRLTHLEFVPLGTHLWMLVVSLLLFQLLFRIFRIYDSIRIKSLSRVLIDVTKPFLIAVPVLGSVVFLVRDKTFSRAIFGGFLALYFALILAEKCGIKVLQNRVRRRGYNHRSLLMVGVGSEAALLARLIGGHAHLGMRVIGHLSLNGEPGAPGISAPVLGQVNDLPFVLDHHVVDEVFFAVPPRDLLDLEPHIWKCEEVGLRVHLKADFIRTLLSRTYTSDLDGIPVLTFASTPHAAGPLLVKRGMDILLSAIGLIVMSPLLLLIAVAVRLTSPGPALYRQSRAGLNGRTFTLLKFRSMSRDAESRRPALEALNEMSGPVFKMTQDPRVTPLGRLLRRYSLDELPQLWNVLRGDMSIVGPRPPIPDEVVRYERWQRRRLSMKPGITCLWQVNGRNEVGFPEWMKMDMDYIDNWSLSLDLRILTKTFSVVLLARGAH